MKYTDYVDLHVKLPVMYQLLSVALIVSQDVFAIQDLLEMPIKIAFN